MRLVKYLPWFWLYGLCLAWILRHALGDRWWPLAVIWMLTEPACLAAAILFALPTLHPRFRAARRPMWLSVLPALAIVNPIYHSSQQVPRTALKVMQLNMEHGLGGVDKVAALIERENPDILFLEEAGPVENRDPRIEEALAPYEVHREHFEAVCVRGQFLSKEIALTDPLQFSVSSVHGGKMITAAKARVRDHEVRLAVVHFSPTQPEKLLPKLGEMHDYLVNLADSKKRQFESLAKYIEEHGSETVIVGGDFNAHPVGPNYQTLSAVAIDTFRAVGSGLGYTLPTKFPIQRFDYIWVRNSKPLKVDVLPDAVSDHLGLVAWVEP